MSVWRVDISQIRTYTLMKNVINLMPFDSKHLFLIAIAAHLQLHCSFTFS